MTKICDVCGAEFVPSKKHESTQKYCSKACQRMAMLARKKQKLAECSTVGKMATCKICGREYIKEYSRHVYCSDKCKSIGFGKNIQKARQKAIVEHVDRNRSRARRGSQEYTKKCIVCGKVFTTWFPQKKTCSEECKIHNATTIKRERDRIRSRYRKITPEEQHAQWIRRRYGSEENYQKWLAEQERLKQELKQKREQERLKRKEAYENQLEVWRITREARKEANHRKDTCIVCGKEYETYNPAQKTCSKECGKKLARAHKHKRIPKSQLVDKDITLEALYRRDSGVCYLCGEKCDWNDKTDKSVGPAYPSIDHMMPISRGGLHSWANVKLAHFECNWKKSDDLPPSFSSTG